MGLFKSKNVFSSRDEIRKKLFSIRSLDYRERPKVYEALMKELDDGGVTAEEIKLVVRHLREDKEISEIDRENLLQILKE